jgi:hypothetical protein
VVAARFGRQFIATDVSFRAVHTSRTRLISSGSSVFEIKQVKGSRPVAVDQHISGKLSMKLEGRVVKLKAENPEDIDYWEVDPAWDGKLFRSAAQATRPRGIATIPDHLDLPFPDRNLPVAARLVDIHGNINKISI